MDINRLHEFLVLADCLNYSKAANLLFLTQPVLSRHIHDLEQTFDAQLFVRDTHKVELTEIGELAARELSVVVETYNNAVNKIQKATDTANGNLKVGFLGYAVKPFITNFSGQFEAQHPHLSVDYISSDGETLISSINDESIDLAFVIHVSPTLSKSMESRHILDDQLCVVVPTQHPFNKKECISFKELAGESFIAFREDTNPNVADFHKTLFSRFGMEMNVVRTVSNIESALFYVGMGVGLFLLPRHLSSMSEDLQVLPIVNEDVTCSLHLIWKKNNPKPAIQTFVRDFSKFYSTQENGSV